MENAAQWTGTNGFNANLLTLSVRRMFKKDLFAITDLSKNIKGEMKSGLLNREIRSSFPLCLE